MAEHFDPYHKWLAIPPHEHPPNHYRLLGVELFEADPDVIDSAADKCMAHLRSFQTGKNSKDAQKLLNEVSAARVCLLNSEQRASYDMNLRQMVASQLPALDAFSEHVFATATAATPMPSFGTAQGSPSMSRRLKRTPGWVIPVVATVAVAVLLGIGIVVMNEKGETIANVDQSDNNRDAANKIKPADKTISDKIDGSTVPNNDNTSIDDPTKKADEPINDKPDDTPKPTPMPEVTPVPMPTTPMPTMPTPPQPAPPKEVVNAFAALPPAKNLPELGTAAMPVAGYDAPFLFGDVKVNEADILLLRLEGGEEASRSTNEKFLIANARGGTTPRDFEISLQHADESKVLIARIWIEEDKLKFQWTPDSLNEPNSNYLRNCVLSLRAGASVKDVTLREPVTLGSLVPNFAKDSSITQQYAADWLPDLNKVRIEITVDNKFPPHRFDPVNELDAAGGKAKVLLGDEITLPDNIRFFPAYLTIESKLRRNGGEIELALFTTYAVKNKLMPGKYVEKKVDDSIKAFQGQSAFISNQLSQFQQNAKNLKTDRDKQEAEIQLNFLNESQKSSNAIIAAYGGVKAYPAQIQGAKISATVFFLAGEYKVILAKN